MNRINIDDLCAWLRTTDPEVLISDLRRMLPGLDRSRRLLEAGEAVSEHLRRACNSERLGSVWSVHAAEESLASYQEAAKP